jgi:hypothetical protein
MITLLEAAQQALKSLRGYRREIGCEQPCDAERALEAALEQEQETEPKSTWQKLYETAIDQRNEAVAEVKRLLEQPEPPPMRAPKENDRVICIEDESLGTVLWTDAAGGPYVKFDDGSYGQWMLHEFGKLFRYAALEQPEQPEQEPCVKTYSGGKPNYTQRFTLSCGCPSQHGGVPAYWERDGSTAFGMICEKHWHQYGARSEA